MNFLKTIYSILCSFGKAKYAAELSRNGKYKEAQALYRN
jgi:hypothetical protein